MPRTRTAILIPCYNEAATIQSVIRDFRQELPAAEIYVFDNNSTDRSVPLAQACGDDGISAEDRIEFGDLAKTYQQSTFGGQFAEVGVHAATGEIRIRRMLAVCASGRIPQPKNRRAAR